MNEMMTRLIIHILIFVFVGGVCDANVSQTCKEFHEHDRICFSPLWLSECDSSRSDMLVACSAKESVSCDSPLDRSTSTGFSFSPCLEVPLD